MTSISSGAATRAPLLIHVGYHKTGTTWLQRILFQPRYGYRPLMEHEEIFKLLVRPHGLTFDAAGVGALIAERRGQADGLADLISSEILVGNPLNGGRESDVYAHRLKAVAPDARILLSIREQHRALVSTYMQYVLRGGTLKPAQFFADDPVVGYVAFAPEHLQYHRLVGLYRDLFGPENVEVVTQEALAKDARGLARRLADFVGIEAPDALATISTDPMSPSASEFAVPVLRRINHFRSGPAGLGPVFDLGPVSDVAYRTTSWLSRRPAVRKLLDGAHPVARVVRDRFTGYYAESNRQLQAMLGDRIDLSKYER